MNKNKNILLSKNICRIGIYQNESVGWFMNTWTVIAGHWPLEYKFMLRPLIHSVNSGHSGWIHLNNFHKMILDNRIHFKTNIKEQTNVTFFAGGIFTCITFN